MTKETVKNYWEQFLASLPPDSPYRTKTYVAEGWGDSPEMADELGALIAGNVSIIPLQLDLTNYKAMDILKSWEW